MTTNTYTIILPKHNIRPSLFLEHALFCYPSLGRNETRRNISNHDFLCEHFCDDKISTYHPFHCVPPKKNCDIGIVSRQTCRRVPNTIILCILLLLSTFTIDNKLLHFFGGAEGFCSTSRFKMAIVAAN